MEEALPVIMILSAPRLLATNIVMIPIGPTNKAALEGYYNLLQ